MNNLTIENAKIGFRNFSGKPGQFNPAGMRNFCIFLDKDIADDLKKDGWNVKELKAREEGDEPQPYLQVAVRFDNIPPNIVIVGANGKSRIDESEVGMLDWAEIENVDLTLTPYEYDFNGNKGIKAYLKKMYVILELDPLEAKYADIKDSAQNAVGGCGNCDICDGHGDCHGD